MPTTPTPDPVTDPAPAALVPAAIGRYPVLQADGSTRVQLILVTGQDEDGRDRGLPVGFEDQAASFEPGQLLGPDDPAGA